MRTFMKADGLIYSLLESDLFCRVNTTGSSVTFHIKHRIQREIDFALVEVLQKPSLRTNRLLMSCARREKEKIRITSSRVFFRHLYDGAIKFPRLSCFVNFSLA